jgi:hypothetical protein
MLPYTEIQTVTFGRMNTHYAICNSVLLDIVHRLYFNKIATFRKLDLLPSSGKKVEDRTLLQIITHHRQNPLDFTNNAHL